jgi:hypothetical protein
MIIYVISLQDLMQTPWSRINDYVNLLASLKLQTSKEHPDQENITRAQNKLRELHIFIKKVISL